MQAARVGELGVWGGVSNEDYHAGPGLSCSQVKRLRKTPYHFHAIASATDQPPKAPTAAMVNGTLTHCALLEPGEFDARYVIGPDLNKNSNAWKAFALQTLDMGAEVIDALQRDRAFAQAASLRALPDVATLLADGNPEVSAYWFDDDDGAMPEGVLCKCRPDWVSPVAYGTGAVLVDVKTTTDASEKGFAKACENFGYHLQADWYCRGYARASGLQVFGMVFAVVESEFPFAAATYMLSDSALALARKQNAEALRTYAQCRRADSWPGYPQGIQVIDLPRWAYA
jgi:hypothetical protein